MVRCPLGTLVNQTNKKWLFILHHLKFLPKEVRHLKNSIIKFIRRKEIHQPHPLLNTLLLFPWRVQERHRLSYKKLSPSGCPKCHSEERSDEESVPAPTGSSLSNCLKHSPSRERGIKGGEGVSDWAEKPGFKAKIKAFQN